MGSNIFGILNTAKLGLLSQQLAIEVYYLSSIYLIVQFQCAYSTIIGSYQDIK